MIISCFVLISPSEGVHSLCLQWTTSESPFDYIYQSLLCGEKLKKNDIYLVLISAGLIHLFVVSGAHILFLETLLNRLLLKFMFKKLAITSLLIIYAHICLWSPPITRALSQYILKSFNGHLKLNHSPLLILLLSIIISLCFQPAWMSSISLPLSWVASLQFISPNKSPLTTNIKIYLTMLPLTLMLTPLHPYSILFNTLFAPVVSHVLFPLTLISGAFTPLRGFCDLLWEQSLKVLSLTTQMVPSGMTDGFSISVLGAWAYAIGLHFIYTIIYKRRNF